MIIKNTKRSKIWKWIYFPEVHPKGKLIFWGILLYTLLLFVFGAYVHRSRYYWRVKESIKLISKESSYLIPKIRAGILSYPEHLFIDMSYKDFQKLAYLRKVALSKGILLTSSNDYVNATIRYKDKSIKVKLRLKGDWTDHLEGNKWSFRVKVKGDNTLFGMKTFSLQHPKTRNYIYEWIFHQTLKREGVLSLRYEFVEVTLNGRNLGIYALEEHFDKQLIEHNQHREGPIIKLNEDVLWADRVQYPLPYKSSTGLQSVSSSYVDVFKANRVLKDTTLTNEFLIGNNLLESFRRQILPTHKAFDIVKLARYYAISELMGAVHGAGFWHNLRFYYNPITSLLEPIGFDGNAGHQIMGIFGANQNWFYSTFFSDKLFFEEYVKTLERISQPSYLAHLFSELDQELAKNLTIIRSEFPQFYFSKDVFYQNQNYIKKALNPVRGLYAFFHKISKNRIELKLGNIQSMPLEALNLALDDSMLFFPSQRTFLSAKDPSQPIDYRTVCFSFPKDFVWSDTMIQDLRLNYKILGASRVRSETVFSWPYLSEHFVENDFIRQQPNVHKFDFLVTDKLTHEILIRPGIWELKQNLIIPKGYRVIAREGTQLNLSNSAKILSYSSLELIGSEDYPIVIQSSDSTGQGIVVMNANQKSILRYVIFNNLSNPSQEGWELTGAVTFYESPVELSYCKFIGNRSEDGLNIIRSEFTIDNTLFKHTFSDAFDGDFVDGKITNSSFRDCGNDGVDVSGSVIDLQNVIINGAGDKGLSAGENTQMNAHDIEIKNAEIAVASKDMSTITINNIKISDSKIGLTSYQKKSEFGASSITVRNLQKGKIEIPYLVEVRSKLIIDGSIIEPNRKNVKEILYGVEFGKSSK